MSTTSSRPWLTADAHARLAAELAALHREPDLDGDDQFERRQHRQARIRQLQDLLQNAVVGEDPPDDGIAEPGMVLTVRYDDGGVETFLLAARDEVGGGLEVYSPDSPLGRALHGAKPGEQREYEVPSGALVRVTLVEAYPYGRYRNEG
ncbi:transcription elongation factor GreAB [Amycolatopsis sp. AA4]|uniref:GreA/GreB family elongation factor n=1 Tax=Actinomycetes TaxID=1760 RepID=UPI0001B58AC8|nr:MULTISPECIES: GreA/GreB family elongation factor [Actinomycetes]ATY10449.1 transcription elongation factor GreAB [Amycolatopsis sp. AA4]EFL05936.1 GreA/GreB family elongation factor [Streptomyces sp. AA4]